MDNHLARYVCSSLQREVLFKGGMIRRYRERKTPTEKKERENRPDPAPGWL